MEKARTFTEAQRQYILSRDGGCQFHSITLGHWRRCNSTKDLQVHHVVPRGYASQHYPYDFVMYELNAPYNLITLCKFHHIGNPKAVHPDTFEAWQKYRKGDKGAYDEMMRVRHELNAQGLVYWNTSYDMMFVRILAKVNPPYMQSHEFPERRATCGIGG